MVEKKYYYLYFSQFIIELYLENKMSFFGSNCVDINFQTQKKKAKKIIIALNTHIINMNTL